MDKLDDKKSIKKQLRQKRKKEFIDYGWILKIVVLTFMISIIFSMISELVISNINVIVGIMLVVIFIIIGILFDMVGVAVTSADEKPFHSMNSRRVKGADIAVLFKKNADKVSSFCNDVVGDICGIISGSAGSIIAISLSNNLKINILIVTLITTAIIASLTIGGKALGKSIAINKSNTILFKFSKMISCFYKIKKY